jgi:hypothetical protein
MAQTAEAVAPWSLIAKGASGAAKSGSSDPAAPEYWKRETLVYQTGLLAKLPGGLTAPRCFAIQEPMPDEWWLWIEDIRESSSRWTLDQYSLAARHLGQFNGAYLVSHPLPDFHPWLTRGRLRPALERRQVNLPPPEFAATDWGQKLVQASQFDRVEKLLAYRQALLQAVDRLPNCFCHLDAFRRNLFIRKGVSDIDETVAIDWSYAGLGSVGEEVGLLTRISLAWMDAPASQAKALSDFVFDGYLIGLRDAGWQGDVHLVRFGYAITVAMGIGWLLFMMDLLQDANNVPIAESVIGHPVDDQIAQLAELQPFYLDMGDEAISLLPTIA